FNNKQSGASQYSLRHALTPFLTFWPLSDHGSTATQSCFLFNITATTEIYTLSLHDALPISPAAVPLVDPCFREAELPSAKTGIEDRKSTRLNSSHVAISYAVFCLKKKTDY